MTEVVVYTPRITERLKYAVGATFEALGVLEFHLTDDKNAYRNNIGVSINYSWERIKDKEFFVHAKPLLFEPDIVEQDIVCFEWRGQKAFFKTEDDVGFDFFAAAFYLLSRYEEYLPHTKDSYGRFPHTGSLAFRENFLHLPLVNIWLQEVARLLLHKYPALVLQPSAFEFLPTYDVDIAFSHKGKGLVRNIGALALSLLRFNLNAAWVNVKSLFSSQHDPGLEVFKWLQRMHIQYGIKPHWFFLAAQKIKGYDRNTSPKHPLFQNIAKQLNASGTIGLHPSTQSFNNSSLLHHEKEVLEEIIQERLIDTRQHYILFNLPETFETLISSGFKHDYSMGYGSINGFRASYCRPFKWFHLPKNQITDLTLHPFCFMDANSNFEQDFTAEEAESELLRYYHITKKVNGKLITVFHNHFLLNEKKWQLWRSMYSRFLATVHQEKN